MMFRRSRSVDLETAHEALAQGQYDVAFAMLENAVRRGAGRGQQGPYWLHLAALYALYGEDGIDNGQPALRSAVSADPNLVSHPLYRALYWEFSALRGASVGDVKRGVREVIGEDDPVASYHAASALFAVGASRSSGKALAAVAEDELPAYLRWRRWSLLGQCHEAMGEWENAAEAFERAVDAAPPPESGAERLSLAGALIELQRTEDALEVLSGIEDDLLSDEERAVQRYLLGRAHLELDNPNLALELLREAASLDDGAGEPSYSVAFATGQALSALGRQDEAAEAFRQALEVAPAEHRAFTQHEAAFALTESDRLAEAEELLAEVVSDPSYSHRAEALADLADVRFRRGEFESAQTLAEQALELGATAPACITLGNIAYEYYRLEEAASWFEQAVSASSAGDPFWVSAHQMLADVYAQMGEEHADQVLLHARAALEHTDPASEWYLPLTQIADEAKARLGGFDRLLN